VKLIALMAVKSKKIKVNSTVRRFRLDQNYLKRVKENSKLSIAPDECENDCGDNDQLFKLNADGAVPFKLKLAEEIDIQYLYHSFIEAAHKISTNFVTDKLDRIQLFLRKLYRAHTSNRTVFYERKVKEQPTEAMKHNHPLYSYLQQIQSMHDEIPISGPECSEPTNISLSKTAVEIQQRFAIINDLFYGYNRSHQAIGKSYSEFRNRVLFALPVSEHGIDILCKFATGLDTARLKELKELSMLFPENERLLMFAKLELLLVTFIAESSSEDLKLFCQKEDPNSRKPIWYWLCQRSSKFEELLSLLSYNSLLRAIASSMVDQNEFKNVISYVKSLPTTTKINVDECYINILKKFKPYDNYLQRLNSRYKKARVFKRDLNSILRKNWDEEVETKRSKFSPIANESEEDCHDKAKSEIHETSPITSQSKCDSDDVSQMEVLPSRVLHENDKNVTPELPTLNEELDILVWVPNTEWYCKVAATKPCTGSECLRLHEEAKEMIPWNKTSGRALVVFNHLKKEIQQIASVANDRIIEIGRLQRPNDCSNHVKGEHFDIWCSLAYDEEGFWIKGHHNKHRPYDTTVVTFVNREKVDQNYWARIYNNDELRLRDLKESHTCNIQLYLPNGTPYRSRNGDIENAQDIYLGVLEVLD